MNQDDPYKSAIPFENFSIFGLKFVKFTTILMDVVQNIVGRKFDNDQKLLVCLNPKIDLHKITNKSFINEKKQSKNKKSSKKTEIENPEFLINYIPKSTIQNVVKNNLFLFLKKKIIHIFLS